MLLKVWDYKWEFIVIFNTWNQRWYILKMSRRDTTQENIRKVNIKWRMHDKLYQQIKLKQKWFKHLILFSSFTPWNIQCKQNQLNLKHNNIWNKLFIDLYDRRPCRLQKTNQGDQIKKKLNKVRSLKSIYDQYSKTYI